MERIFLSNRLSALRRLPRLIPKNGQKPIFGDRFPGAPIRAKKTVQKKHKAFEETQALCQQALHRIQTEFDKAEAQREQQRAAELAAHLHDGDTCPVCANRVSEAQLATYPKDFNLQHYALIKQQYQEAKDELAAAKSDVAHSAARLAELEIPKRELADIETEQQRLGQQYEAHMSQRKNLAAMRSNLQQLTEQVALNTDQLQQARIAYDKSQQALQQQAAGWGYT